MKAVVALPWLWICATSLKPFPDDAKLIFLNTSEGIQLLQTASHTAPYWQIAPHFTTQLPGMCGPTTAAVVLNAFSAQGLQPPLSTEYSYSFAGHEAEYHYWEHINVWNGTAGDCVAKRTQPWQGSLEQVASFFSCRGLQVDAKRANLSTVAEFRSVLRDAFDDKPLRFVTVNFDRQVIGQSGVGHHSPVGAYDVVSDRVLIMDVARYRFPPWWVPVETMFAAMSHVSTSEMGATPRGFLVLAMPMSHEDEASGSTSGEIVV